MAKKKLSLRDYAHKLNRYNEAIDLLKEEIAGKKETLAGYEERVTLIKERMLLLMDKEEKTMVISGLHQYSKAKTPDALVIVDEKLVPKQFQKSVTKVSIDKALIKSSIKEGTLKKANWYALESGFTLKHKELEEE